MAVNKSEMKRALKLCRQVQDVLNKKKFVQGVSVNDSLQSFDSGTGVVSVTIPGNFIENVSITGGSASIDNQTLYIDVDSASGGAFTLNGAEVNNVTITGATIDANLKSATIVGSDNNFTNDFKNKLTSIESGAQVNKLEGLIFNGTAASIDANKNAIVSLQGGSSDAIENINITGGTVSIANNVANITVDAVQATNFAKQIFACTSGAELRSYWGGFKDIDFDECGNSWTAVGSPFMSDKNSAFGHALQLNGSSCLKLDNTIQLGGSPFTIDCWGFISSADNYPSLWTLYLSANERLRICARPSLVFGVVLTSDGNSYSFTDSSVPANDSPHHVELGFDSASFYFFVDGHLVSKEDKSFPARAFQLLIGYFPVSDNYYHGSISEFRISNICRHTSDFTPPTSPYTVDENTVSLLHFDC